MKHKVEIKYRYGFTLIELLLALAIAAIVGISVYSMFWSGVKLDDKMRRVHDDYMEVLMANQGMSHDLENAISLDFSNNYPDSIIFDGQNNEFAFITQTSGGLKRVHYYSGLLDEGPVTKSMIGRVVNSSGLKNYSKESSPVEFLLRQESSLADWLNETSNDTSTQIVAAGLKKGSFGCQYAPMVKDLHTNGSKGINFKDSWSDKDLPLAVSCSFILYDPKKPQEGLMFKRDIFLAPLATHQGVRRG